MTKRIIVLSDGTGNAAANLWRTNVWRTFDALDLTGSEQVAAYDDGVGTSSFKPMAILGGAFGWGLKRNVLNLYKFLCRNYSADGEEGPDRIFGFGFSRGAFTIRVLSGLVLHQGLLDNRLTDADLNRLAKCAYRAYRAERYKSYFGIERPFRALRDCILHIVDRVRGRKSYDRNLNVQVEEIRFLGLWDTVAAYGLPIEEMTRGVSKWLWPLELPDRTLSERVSRACHALALDEERTTFSPILWNESKDDQDKSKKSENTKDERISQVWFAGVHSNVGGGYPDDRLAYISYHWILQEAKACGLVLKKPPDAEPDAILRARSGADKDGRLYDPRKGLGGYYRYGPRKISDLCKTPLKKSDPDFVSIDIPKIHASALQRIRANNIYAPVGFPAVYSVVDGDGKIYKPEENMFETPVQAASRLRAQEMVWNEVWKRRLIYFLTLIASFNLVFFPLLYDVDKSDEFAAPVRIISEALRFFGSFLPHIFSTWISAFAARPLTFSAGAFAIGVLIWINKGLANGIIDNMRTTWIGSQQQAPEPSGIIYAIRNNRYYQNFIRSMKRKIVPFFSAIVVVYVVVAISSHLLFNIADSLGAFCTPSEQSELKEIPARGDAAANRLFDTREICWSSGIRVEKGVRYQFEIRKVNAWRDASITTDLGGFQISEIPSFRQRIVMTVAVPFRRVIMRPWFLPILRIGQRGTDEYFADPPENLDTRELHARTTGAFRARRSGELFVYVNDAGLAIPWAYNVFYNNNEGTAVVIVRRTARQ
ncbi:MAG: DUF2235 domain-containing protein [Beijerinckiaceae bacterium]